MRDLELGEFGDRHALATLHGKGGKRRKCPLLPQTESAICELVRGRSAGEAVLVSRYRRPYTVGPIRASAHASTWDAVPQW